MSKKKHTNESEKELTVESLNILYGTRSSQKMSPKNITMMLENVLPPHTDDEKRMLEANIVRDGEIRNPLVIWKDGNKNILIDGLMRHQIAIKLKLDCPVTFKEFSSAEEAKVFILEEQLGRRNVSDYSLCEIALGLDELIKSLGREHQSKGGKGCQIKDEDRIDAKKILGKKAGVSHDTFAKAKKISKEVKDPEVINALRNGDRSISSAYNELTGKNLKSEPIQKQLFEAFGGLIPDWSTLKSMTIIPSNDGSFKIEVLTKENEKQVYETVNQISVTETKPKLTKADEKLMHLLYEEYDFGSISNISWEDIRTMFLQDVQKIDKYISLKMDVEAAFRVFVEKLRLELYKNWVENNQPLGGGRKTEKKIISELKKFKDTNSSTILMSDDSGNTDLLSTGTKLTSGINQIFPEMMDTPTQSGKSPMDVIKDPIVFLKFMERVIVRDGLHLFTKSLEYKTNKLKKAA